MKRVRLPFPGSPRCMSRCCRTVAKSWSRIPLKFSLGMGIPMLNLTVSGRLFKKKTKVSLTCWIGVPDIEPDLRCQPPESVPVHDEDDLAFGIHEVGLGWLPHREEGDSSG